MLRQSGTEAVSNGNQWAEFMLNNNWRGALKKLLKSMFLNFDCDWLKTGCEVAYAKGWSALTLFIYKKNNCKQKCKKCIVVVVVVLPLNS